MTNDFPAEFGGHSDPFEIFKLWFDEAHQTKLLNPNSFVLSTVDKSGQPQARVLLCKEVTDTGFVFYSNYESAKGLQLNLQNKASMNFFWDSLSRQIKITGEVTRTSREESVQYWVTRDRMSQLSQWVSKQSQALSGREEMETAIAQAEKDFAGKDIPCPDHWGGYLMSPSKIEFWVGRSGRFHDRHLFTMVENNWAVQRLYP